MRAATLVVLLLATASFAAPVAVAASAEPADLAPNCGTLAGVRCADGGRFCNVYLNVGAEICV